MSINFSVEVLPFILNNPERSVPLSTFRGERRQIKVFVPFMPNRDTGKVNLDLFLKACRTVAQLGYIPVPHIAPRRLHNLEETKELLSQLKKIPKLEEMLIIAGDPSHKEVGPWCDTIEFMESGILKEFTDSVLFGGRPEGHHLGPGLKRPVDQSIKDILQKVRIAQSQGIDSGLVTQFSLSSESLSSWLGKLQEQNPSPSVSIGIVASSTLRQKLNFAQLCGLGASRDLLLRNPKLLFDLIRPQDLSKQAEAISELKDRGYNIYGCHAYSVGNLDGTFSQLSTLQKKYG